MSQRPLGCVKGDTSRFKPFAGATEWAMGTPDSHCVFQGGTWGLRVKWDGICAHADGNTMGWDGIIHDVMGWDGMKAGC